MKVYALRQRGTNKYMPALKTNRGSSHYDPVENGGDLGPRLFISQHAAKCALVAWLRGEYEYKSSPSRYSSPYDFEHDARLTLVPRPHRAQLGVEVVAFDLVEAA